MTAKARASTLARLARLEAAVAARPRPGSQHVIPAVHAEVLQYQAAEHATLPSARALHRAFAACCDAFPDGRDANLADPAVASLIPAVRAELVIFLWAHLGTDRGYWSRSTAWMHLTQAGIPNPYHGVRERGPTAEEWCAGLSPVEVLFEAAACLLGAAIRVDHWREMRDSTDEAVREAVRLPAEEEAVLLAEVGA